MLNMIYFFDHFNSGRAAIIRLHAYLERLVLNRTADALNLLYESVLGRDAVTSKFACLNKAPVYFGSARLQV